MASLTRPSTPGSHARQRRLLCVATATPQSRHGGAQGRRLLRVTLLHHGVGSRFSLKQPLGAPCGSTMSAQGFLSRWSLEPTAVTREGFLSPSPSPGSSLPWSCCRQASTSATRRGGPVPALRWSRRTTALLHALCSSKRAPVLPLRQGVKLASAHYERPSGWLSNGSWQRQGHSHSKPKNMFPCYLSVGQFLCWKGPASSRGDAV